ncbi:hypothetical protein [Methylobacterium sp. J-092]|uniref:hypothetical protein n=1 Tax=Methylobacterium sp. J-092 TaxID=2836667 RepID=UPI001FBABD6C|nr:hypothetical protein [Methylobacterium sp. J-092]MCJ2005633.1 hypothetical protein [Methylobacterium sp. J-092]
MRFVMPHYPCDFEIPDDWLGAISSRTPPPAGAGYHPSAPATLVPLADIQPPRRDRAFPLEWHGMERHRFVRVLEWMVGGNGIEPVPLLAVPPLDGCNQLYPFVVYDGLHRFYASIVAGFDHLPAEIHQPAKR